jgi:hypothetical protein
MPPQLPPETTGPLAVELDPDVEASTQDDLGRKRAPRLSVEPDLDAAP